VYIYVSCDGCVLAAYLVQEQLFESLTKKKGFFFFFLFPLSFFSLLSLFLVRYVSPAEERAFINRQVLQSRLDS
jgi:hypothetical protein